MKDYDYIDIGARIRAANRMRSQALGKLLAAAWAGLKRRAAKFTHAAAAPFSSLPMAPHR